MVRNKIKMVKISAQIITEIMKLAVENKLPKDAEVLRTSYNVLTNCFELVIYSKDFPKVKEGDMIPELENPTVRKGVYTIKI